MIFLVGARRSGTNWFQRMLNCHPHIVSIPSETYLFSHGIEPLTALFQHGVPTSPATGTIYMDRARLVEATRRFCDEVFGELAALLDPKASRILERTPWHAKHLDLIARIYPDARILHIIRDGRTVTRSLLAQPWGPATMDEAAAEWASTVEAARSAQVPHYLEVRYEKLRADPIEGIGQVFAWLDLPFDMTLRSQVSEEAAVPQNMTFADAPEDIGVWWSHLSAEEQEDFDGVAGSLLRSLGYTHDPANGTPRHRRRAPGTQRVRAVLQQFGFRLRRSRWSAAPPRRDLLGEPVGLRMEGLVRAMDEFISALQGGDYRRLAATLSEKARVNMVGPGGRQSGRGPVGTGLLIDALRKSEPSRLSPISANAHYSPLACTAVLGYRDAAGRETDLVFVLEFREDGAGSGITAVTVYGAR